jgi:hypothetical protein
MVCHSKPKIVRKRHGKTRTQIGGKVNLGGLERWFSPRGQDLVFSFVLHRSFRPSNSV